MITSTTARVAFTLTGSGQTLAFSFPILAAEDIAVMKTVAGVDTTLTLTTHYTVNVSGQSITMMAGANGDVITVYRVTPLTQTTDLLFNGQFSSGGIEATLDRLVMQAQALKLMVERSVRLPMSSAAVVPLDYASRANKVIGFSSLGVLELKSLAGIELLGTVATSGDLPSSGNTDGDAYLVAGDLYVWSNGAWSDQGPFKGDDGAAGAAGPGLPAGGAKNSRIRKKSATDYDTEWVPQEFINVRDYGATGDGSTDDITAINLAVAALPADHGMLYFPPGKYKIGAGITAFASKTFLTIRGDGAEIYNVYHGNTIVLENTCSNVNISGLWFTGDATVRASGIHIRCHASDVNITDNYFQGCSDFGVFIGHDNTATRNYRVNVEANIFSETLGDGVHVMNAGDVVIADNILSGTGDDAIGIVADVTATPPERVLISGNWIYDSASRGIAILEATFVTVTGNVLKGISGAGIDIGRLNSTTAYNTNITIDGNKLHDCVNGGSGPRGAIWLRFLEDSTISNNTITDTNYGSGINFLDLIDCVIDGNKVKVTASRAIDTDDSTTTNVAANWGSVVISNNVVDEVAANEAIYVVGSTGKTINNIVVCGNVGLNLPSGNWIYYDLVTTGRIVNNTNLESKAVGAGGTVSGVTAANNN